MNTRCQVRMRAVGWCYTTVAVIIWLCAVLRDMPLLYLLAATLLGPLFFSWRQAYRGMRYLSAERRVPFRSHVGQSVVVEFAIRNDRSDSSAWAIGIADRMEGGSPNALALPVAALSVTAPPAATNPGTANPGTANPGTANPNVANSGTASAAMASTATGARAASDSAAVPAAAGAARVFFPHVGPGEECVESYLWQPLRRGRYGFASARLTSCFPLGLFEATRPAIAATQVLAVPALGRLKAEWRGWCDRAGREAAGSSQRRGLLEGDYYGLREWRPGDSRRWIHWRSSARQGSLTTLQFEQPRRDELFLVVDLWSPDNPTAAQREAVERALAFAATVVVEFGRRGDRVLRFGLAAAESRIWLEPLRAIDRDELLDSLAEAEPSAAPDLAQAAHAAQAARASQRVARGSGSVGSGSVGSGSVGSGPVGFLAGAKTLAGVWAVASTRPASPEVLTRLAAAGMPRGSSPLWIDFSSAESRVWFALAGEP